eukprot:2922858-Prymnesium_polylepis.1
MGSRPWWRFMNDHFLDSPVDMGPPGSEAVKREDLSEELPFYRTGVRFSRLTPADFGDDDAPNNDSAPREACRRLERGVARRKSAQAYPQLDRAGAHAGALDTEYGSGLVERLGEGDIWSSAASFDGTEGIASVVECLGEGGRDVLSEEDDSEDATVHNGTFMTFTGSAATTTSSG